ncbi:MAG TPA: YcnI family protein [Bacillales bacterium]|nr:YcnI family protein [Bacillales bacterium]
MVRKIVTSLSAMVIVLVLFAGVASAHVEVMPGKVEAGSYQTFTVSVPSEKENANTTSIRIAIPEDVEIFGVEPRAGWTYETKKNESGKITSIKWSAANEGLKPGEFVELKMKGKVSKEAQELVFKAYQTYSDGSVVKWVENEDGEHPASVTKVTAAAAEKSSDGGRWPLYISIVSLLLSIAAIVGSARNKRTV